MHDSFWMSLLLRGVIVNYAVLLLTFAAFIATRERIYRLHSRWFELSRSRFDAIVYILLGLYKLAIWFFLLVPCLVLWSLQ